MVDFILRVTCSMSRCIVRIVSLSVISRPTTDCIRLYLSCYKLNKKFFYCVLVYLTILTIQQRAGPSVSEIFPQLNVFQGTLTLECILS